LLAFVFVSQLFWAGYVTPWSKAFTQEVVYWLSWGILAPVIFWMCRRLHNGEQAWSRYVLCLALGALVASVVQPIIPESIRFVQSGLSWLLILRLGELLRQVLRSSTLPDVPLAEEIEFVRGMSRTNRCASASACR
jgi:hypothetical protein